MKQRCSKNFLLKGAKGEEPQRNDLVRSLRNQGKFGNL